MRSAIGSLVISLPHGVQRIPGRDAGAAERDGKAAPLLRCHPGYLINSAPATSHHLLSSSLCNC